MRGGTGVEWLTGAQERKPLRDTQWGRGGAGQLTEVAQVGHFVL